MFRGLIALAMLTAGAAHAHAVTEFVPAPQVQPAVPAGSMRCGGDSFNANGTVLGACASPHAYACSGRGCQPVTITSYYNVTWAADGTPISGILCKSIRHHLPQANTTTYYNGFTNCLAPALNSSTVVEVDTGYGPSPYYLIATNGLAEIIADGANSYLLVF